MLKISWSTEVESSTTTTTSVCGLKYVPGRTSISSTSTTRFPPSSSPAIGPILSPARGASLLPEILELSELALHLGVDVERLLSLAQAPLVTRPDQLANFRDE